MRKVFLLTFLLLLGGFSAHALTLDEAIAIAKEENLDIKSQEFSYRAAKSEKLKAWGGFLPNVSVSASNGSRKTKIGEELTNKRGVNSKTVTASQNLFDGFGSTFRLKEAGSNINKERAQKNLTLQQINLNVIKSYLQILKYNKILLLDEENLRSQNNLFKYISKRYQARDVTQAEITKAKADLIKAKNDLVVNKNNHDFARADLARHLGINALELENLEEVTLNPAIDVKNDVEEFISLALQHNFELQVAKYQHKAATYNAKAAKSAFAPRVDLKFEVSEQENALYLNNQTQRDNSLYLNVTVPIFSSGLRFFEASAANNIRRREKYNFESMKRKIQNSVIEYYNKQQNLFASYQSAQELEKANQVYLLTVEKEEKLGTKSIIDLLEAKQELLRSKIATIDLFYQLIHNRFELEALIGGLVE